MLLPTALPIALAVAIASTPPQQKSSLQLGLAKMRAAGYRMLIGQHADPSAAKRHGDFAELGKLAAGRLRGETVPTGYRVWAKPFWYIWRDKRTGDTPLPAASSYSPRQATGEPDSPNSADSIRAWCSRTATAKEWLLLEYEKPILATQIDVHENYQHGAIVRVTVFDLKGNEAEVYKSDATKIQTKRRVLEIPLVPGQRTMRVKLYIDGKKKSIWNEIDAVGLTDNHGKQHWAESAHASSSYATIATPVPFPLPKGIKRVAKDRTAALEKEVKKLRTIIEKLQKRIEALERRKR